MAFTLYTQSFGPSYSNGTVLITEATSGLPTTILATATGGVLNTQGQATLDVNGNLAVYIDTAKTYVFKSFDGVTIIPTPTLSLSDSQTLLIQGIASGNGIIRTGGRFATPAIARGIVITARTAIIAAGGTLMDQTLLTDELECLIRSLGSEWTSIRELHIPLGSNLASSYVKLKNDSTASASLSSGAGTPVYDQYAGISCDGSTSYISTGLNPTTAGFSPTSWGFGVYANSLTGTGILGGDSSGTSTYLAYSGSNTSKLNGADVPHIQCGRWTAVQAGGGYVTTWTGGYKQASLVSGAASLPNAPLTLFAINSGGFKATNTLAGYAAWTPALSDSAMTSLSNFFDRVNSGLMRSTWRPSFVAVGDSNTAGGIGGLTTAQRFSNIFSSRIGLTDDNQGVNSSVMSSDVNNANVSIRWITQRIIASSVARLPGLMSVMLGTNDDQYGVPLTSFYSDYLTWLNANIAAGVSPQSIILMSPPASTQSVSSQFRLQAMRDFISSTAASKGCGYVNVYGLTAGRNDLFQGDLLHLNVAGQLAVADAQSALLGLSKPGGTVGALSSWY
jgi:lysophospholipase L1-like esterase